MKAILIITFFYAGNANNLNLSITKMDSLAECHKIRATILQANKPQVFDASVRFKNLECLKVE